MRSEVKGPGLDGRGLGVTVRGQSSETRVQCAEFRGKISDDSG